MLKVPRYGPVLDRRPWPTRLVLLHSHNPYQVGCHVENLSPCVKEVKVPCLPPLVVPLQFADLAVAAYQNVMQLARLSRSERCVPGVI